MTWRQRIKQKRPITTHTSFTLFRMRVSLFQNSLTQTHTHAVWAPTFTIFFPYLYLEYSKQKTTFITPLLLLFFCEAVKLPQSTSGPSFLSVFFPVNKLSLWPPTVYCSSTKYCTVGYWWSQHFCLREIMKPSTNEHQEAYHSTTSREGERERKKEREPVGWMRDTLALVLCSRCAFFNSTAPTLGNFDSTDGRTDGRIDRAEQTGSTRNDSILFDYLATVRAAAAAVRLGVREM